MPTELQPEHLVGGLLAFSRISAMVALLPFPGLRAGPDAARVAFAVLMTWCLRPVWPAAPAAMPGMATLAVWVLAEALFGLLVGLVVSFLLEAFQLGAQMLSIQAGYSYAATVDPNTQADAGVIVVIIQLVAGICFFSSGVDRAILRAVAASFERIPPGTFTAHPGVLAAATQLGSAMVVSGFRIAMPVVAFLLLVDVALALLGRIQSQLQLLSLAFPVKMLASLLLLASMAALFPIVFDGIARRSVATLNAVLGG